MAIAAVVALAVRTRPVKWLWRTIVTQPISHWFAELVRSVVEPILEQMRNNGGSTLVDKVDKVIAGRVADAEDRDRRQAETDGRFTSIEERLAVGSDHLASIDAQLISFGAMIREWRATHPEIRPDPEDPVDD